MRAFTSYKFLAILFLGSGLALQAQRPTKEIESYYDLILTDAERDTLLTGLKTNQRFIEGLHAYPLPNSVGMSLRFDPLPQGFVINNKQNPIDWGLPKTVVVPANKEELAFYSVAQLSVLLKSRKITSSEITRLYLSRLKKYGDTLQCVITLMEQEALSQAAKADQEIAAGKYKGPLHGIPYGVKDLISVKGTKTTWGAMPFKDQSFDETASIVNKLEAAGAVLVAKFTLGALAQGDIWYGGVTKNPWDLSQGSSGSSAGSSAATSAGLVAFSIGTETLGSIVSPSTRCGVTDLRPTYGRVSRHGAMALSWSMDKIGPICRSALDCALVFETIRGTDGKDPNVVDASFNYDAKTDLKKLKIGYLKDFFEADYATKANDQKALEVIQQLGISPEPISFLFDVPVTPIRMMLTAEAAAAFDELTRTGRDSLLVNQRRNAWPNSFRTARFIPAVDYINASRVRKQLIEQYHEKLKDYDVIITPSFGGNQLLVTNLTGHPCLVMPNGFTEKGSPTSISFLGKLFGEAAVLQLGKAFQDATDWDEKTPPLFSVNK